MENKKNQSEYLKKKKDNSFLFSTSLIFDENIDKLWLYLRDLSNEVSNLDFLDDFKYVKGNNTWTVGNIFSLYWVGVSHIQVKCKYINVNRTRKKIKWKFICDIGISYYKTLILYRITQSGKTLVKVNFARTKKKNELIDVGQTLNYYRELQNNILLQHLKYLQNLKKEYILYESCIINISTCGKEVYFSNNEIYEYYLKIWNCLIDFKIWPQISPNIYKNIEYRGQTNEIGSFIKFYDENLKKVIYYKIIGYEMSIQKKNWLCRLESIGSDNINIPIIIEYRIRIINKKKAQLSTLYKFSYNSNPDYIKQFEIIKKEVLKKIIKYVEEN